MRPVVACAVLHALLTIPMPWERRPIIDGLLSVPYDAVALVAGAWCVALLVDVRWWSSAPLALLVVFLFVHRTMTTMVPAYWGRPFDLYEDVHEAWGLWHLLFHDRDTDTVAWAAATAAFGSVVLIGLLDLQQRAIMAAATRSRALTAAALTAIAMCVVPPFSPGDPPASSVRLAATDLWHVATDHWSGRHAARVDRELAAAVKRQAAAPADLGRWKTVDVHVLFIESYGRVFHQSDAGVATLARLQGTIDAADQLEAISHYLRPSVCGGGSSFSHAEFYSGFPVDGRTTFERVIASDLRPIPKLFQDAGHLTINVQPAMPEPWPDGMAYYGFDQDWYASKIPWDGGRYHWGVLPDQAALALILRGIEPVKGGRVFTSFISVTSHAPFVQIPAFIDDWSRAADAATHTAPQQTRSIGWLEYVGHPELGAAYQASIAYALRSAVGFAAQLERPSLVIILGDHQPPGLVEIGSETGRDVPIHLIANRPGLLSGWRPHGFVAGLRPPTETRSFPSARFREMFLAAGRP